MSSIYKKEDFFLSGATETAPFFFWAPVIGVVKSFDDIGLAVTRDNVTRMYMSKRGMTAHKDAWLTLNISTVQSQFVEWCAKWDALDKTFFDLATTRSTSWKDAWDVLDKIAEDLWVDSYRVECTDPFAEELEQLVAQNLADLNIKDIEVSDLITPTVPTRAQSVDRELALVYQGRMTREEYLRKFWYIKGTWNGGAVADESVFREQGDISDSFGVREKLQNSIDPTLRPEVRYVAELLRILFLWREERKVQLQKINVAYTRVLEDAVVETKIPRGVLLWVRPREIQDAEKNPNDFSARAKQSVVIARSSGAEILSGQEAQEILEEFYAVKKVSEIKGMVASRGKVTGRARIILREHQFHRFEDGEVLVTTMTRPEYVPLMKKASAIVTDEGGLTSHAAIVARELGKPCVIGTKNATQILEDGDMVEVDAEKGVVRKI